MDTTFRVLSNSVKRRHVHSYYLRQGDGTYINGDLDLSSYTTRVYVPGPAANNRGAAPPPGAGGRRGTREVNDEYDYEGGGGDYAEEPGGREVPERSREDAEAAAETKNAVVVKVANWVEDAIFMTEHEDAVGQLRCPYCPNHPYVSVAESFQMRGQMNL